MRESKPHRVEIFHAPSGRWLPEFHSASRRGAEEEAYWMRRSDRYPKGTIRVVPDTQTKEETK